MNPYARCYHHSVYNIIVKIVNYATLIQCDVLIMRGHELDLHRNVVNIKTC